MWREGEGGTTLKAPEGDEQGLSKEGQGLWPQEVGSLGEHRTPHSFPGGLTEWRGAAGQPPGCPGPWVLTAGL